MKLAFRINFYLKIFAKPIGCIAIIVPNYHKLKEWAYAGLVFDLIGAVYSNLMVDGWNNGMLIMVPVFALVFVSYIYNHKIYAK